MNITKALLIAGLKQCLNLDNILETLRASFYSLEEVMICRSLSIT